MSENFKLSEVESGEQDKLLETILDVKADDGVPESAKVVSLLDKITDPLMKLIVNVTRFQEVQLSKCKEDVTTANAIIVKNVSEREKAPLVVGKALLSRVVGL